MPYVSIDDLPPPVQTHLPLHAREIYLAAFNNAWTEYEDRGPARREEIAHRVAWAAVKANTGNMATSGFRTSPADAAGLVRADRAMENRTTRRKLLRLGTNPFTPNRYR